MVIQKQRILDSSRLGHVFYLLCGLQLQRIHSKRTPFLLLYSLFRIPKKYLLSAKRKVSYNNMSGNLSISVLQWTFPKDLRSYCIKCKRRGMQQCHVFLNCCHVEKNEPHLIKKQRNIEMDQVRGQSRDLLKCIHRLNDHLRHNAMVTLETVNIMYNIPSMLNLELTGCAKQKFVM